MKLGSLFDGSGGFPLAGAMNGMTPVWASEIEPYPLRVTAARFPGMKQLGDVTKIDGAVIEPVDVITFGSPCQDLSVAGKQTGIHDGKRSSLFFEAVRIIREMRGITNGKYPRFAVWENVTGAFSSNKGEDFRAVLQALCEIAESGASVPEPPKGKWTKAGCIVGDGYSIAWRVYDAQYWGVPQRRKRIYLVADFGSERAGEILFERESMCGDFETGREAREDAAAHAAGSAGGSCYASHLQQDPIGGSVGPCIGGQHQATVGVFMGGQGANAGSIAYDETVSPTLRASESGSNRVPDIVYCLQGNGIDRADTAGCNGKGLKEDTSYTLNTIDRPAVTYLASGKQTVGTLMANASTKLWLGNQEAFSGDYHIVEKRQVQYIVRRLTPLECCRLQGFPDWWEDGANGSDSARYKMWGNGIALPCAADVMRRIAVECGICTPLHKAALDFHSKPVVRL